MVIILSLCLLAFSNIVHSANLKLELSSNSVEMGKNLIATFIYKGTSKPELIDLGLWKKDFYIEQADAELNTTETNTIRSTTKARLYPRHTGNITLDAIALGGSFIKPTDINVLPSIRNKVDATPIITILKSHYWADETIIVSIKVPLHYSRNEVIAKEWIINGFSIMPLPSKKTDAHVLLNWMLYTPHKGVYNLELPAIVQRGRGRFRYHSPKISFTIKPLPAYLPSSVATGLINISSKIQASGNDKIALITLQKSGYLPKEIEGFQSFINQLSHDELALNIRTEDSIKKGINLREIKLTLPKWLWNENLNLELNYFNAQTGGLETVKHTLPTVNTLPKSVHYIFIVISITLLLLALTIINKVMRQWRDQKHLKQRILQASNAQELRLIILNNGQFKTLDDWANQIGSSASIELKNLINQACYQQQIKMSLKELKIILISNLRIS